MRTITDEYRSGMIRTTLTAILQRTNVLAARTNVITALPLGVSTTVISGVLVARALVAANGFSPAHSLPLSVGAGPALRAAIGSIL